MMTETEFDKRCDTFTNCETPKVSEPKHPILWLQPGANKQIDKRTKHKSDALPS